MEIGHYVHEPLVLCISLFAVQVLLEELGRFFWEPSMTRELSRAPRGWRGRRES